MTAVDPGNILLKLTVLEAQLAASNDKVTTRENVISQLEEEIKAKEQLIYEQSHLIRILENDHDEPNSEHKFDLQSLNSESEITVIEREVASSSSTSPCSSEKSSSSIREERLLKDDCIRHCRCRCRLEQAMLDRERLELQNEQLLKQWEEALEYVSSVQRQLQEEIKRNLNFKGGIGDRQKSHDYILVSRSFVHLLSVLALFLGYYLYSL